ncbi:MAG: hypothetical protein DRP27_08460 [Thermotogae bacterium]|nr:MAG: hypothetical protein DRP27_08460 [Thermotogota bacterium]
MSMRHKVSAICTTLNCVEGLRETIEYFADYCRRGILEEIIVVDGGSHDGTWETLVELSEKIPCLKVFSRPGYNISQGRNECVSHCTGDIILCFDSGCRYDDVYVEKMLAPFEESQPPDVVGGRTIRVGQTPFEIALANLGKGSASEQMSSHRAIAYRREVFDAVGGYREHVPAGEDTHFNASWIRLGKSFRFLPDAKVYWRVRGNLRSCYRMVKRNIYGHVVLGERFGSRNLYFIVLIYATIFSSIILACFYAQLWLVPIGITLAYWTFRMFRKGRWQFFIKPWNYVRGAMIIVCMDFGMLAGIAKGIKHYLTVRCTKATGQERD